MINDPKNKKAKEYIRDQIIKGTSVCQSAGTKINLQSLKKRFEMRDEKTLNQIRYIFYEDKQDDDKDKGTGRKSWN